MSLSVLQRVQAGDVRAEPYPYAVIENALPEALCDELLASYPALELIGVDATQNNKRWDYSAHQVAGDARIADVWRRFIAYHASPAFLREVTSLFGEALVRLFPERFPDRAALDRLRAGVRGVDGYLRKDILLDAQISGNTPVREATSVRTTHLDGRRALYGGLLYLRRPEDDSSGGDLTISRFKPDIRERRQKLAAFDGSYLAEGASELVETVRYSRNTLVLFINSLDSLHGVTVRQPTPHRRLFVNLLGDMDEPLFELPGDTEKRLAREKQQPFGSALKGGLRKLSKLLPV